MAGRAKPRVLSTKRSGRPPSSAARSGSRGRRANGAAGRGRLLQRLTLTERKALEAEALAQAGPKARQSYQTARPARATLLLGLVREHAAHKLKREAVPAEA